MKTILDKISRGVFTFSLVVFISSGCEDIFFNGDDRFTADNPGNPDITVNPGFVNFNDYLLYATFESDAIPGSPNKTLPGLPSGDELKYNDDVGVHVMHVNGQKSAALPFIPSSATVPQLPGGMAFVSKSTTPDAGDLITFTWSGQLFGYFYNPNAPDEEDLMGATTHITISDGHGQVMCLMVICPDGRFIVYRKESFNNFWQATWPDLFPLDPNPSQHKFTVTFDMEHELFSLKIEFNGGTVVTEHDLVFYSEDYTPKRSQRYRLDISTYRTGGYIIDNATIRQSPVIGPIGPTI